MLKHIGFSLIFLPVFLLAVVGPSNLWVFVFATGFILLYIDTIMQIKKKEG